MKHQIGPGWCLLALLAMPPAPAQVCTYSWINPVDGLFTDPGRWDHQFDCPPGAPRPGDNVQFQPGVFTVTFPGGQLTRVSEFDVSPTPADITFALEGSYSTRVLAISGRLTVSGPGPLAVTELANLGSAVLVLDGVTASLAQVHSSAPGPADPTRQIIVRNGATLTTLAQAGVYGLTVEGGTWHHAGPSNAPPGSITVLAGGRVEAPALDLHGGRVIAEGGSTVEVGQLRSTARVAVRSGSRMINTVADLSFADMEVAGAGSSWTIQRLVVPAACSIVASNRAALVCGELVITDPARFVQVSAVGAESRVQVQTALNLTAGNLAARDGGRFTVPALTVSGGHMVSAGRGAAGLGGAVFECTGALLLGMPGASGGASVQVSGGGRVTARELIIGRSAAGGAVTVDGLNGGTARLEVADDIVVGERGPGQLHVRNGAGAGFTTAARILVVTPDATGNGEVTVEGTDSLLDIPSGALHVARGGPGRLNVTGGGRVTATSLNVGTSLEDAPNAPGSVLISGGQSAVVLREGSASLEHGVMRLVNGGLLHVTADAIEGRLLVMHPARLEVSTGAVNVGAAGSAPGGIVRVDRGLLHGNGTIRASAVEVIAQGHCRPGMLNDTRPVMTIEDGSYLQDAQGTLEVDVAGPVGGRLVLGLNVTRGVTLNGRLIVNFLGAAPQAGEEFGIIRFGEALTGAFSGVELRGLAPGVSFTQRLLSPGVYGLAFTSDGTTAPCPGGPPQIEDLDASVPGEIALVIQSTPCGLHRAEWSDDLMRWTEFAQFSVDAAGRARVVDRQRALSPQRHYRVVRW